MAKREYCCANCGLIWFSQKSSLNQVVKCPECNNDGSNFGHDKGLFACDTFGWYYASEGVVEMFKQRNKKIHYHKDHPWHGKEE